MIIEENNSTTVFILGAGATRGAISHVIVNRKRIKPPLNSDFFAIAENYAKAKGVKSVERKRVTRLRRALSDDIPVRGLPSMEEAFSLFYVAKDFPEIYRTRRGKKPPPGRSTEIEDFLRLSFDIFALLDTKPVKQTGYDRLASKLGSTDTIISLNYDTLMDSALARCGWSPKVGYRLLGGQRKVKWITGIKQDGRQISGVSLLKLHGSINWFVRGRYEKLSKIFASKPVKVTGPRQNEIGGYIRQIVPPVYGKIFEHGHWRRLWKLAFEGLCTANVLVVIGCSLIDTDFHLRALISRAVKHRKIAGCRFTRVILVAPTRTRRRWQKVLKGSCTRFSGYPSFEMFLKKELKA